MECGLRNSRWEVRLAVLEALLQIGDWGVYATLAVAKVKDKETRKEVLEAVSKFLQRFSVSQVLEDETPQVMGRMICGNYSGSECESFESQESEEEEYWHLMDKQLSCAMLCLSWPIFYPFWCH